MKRFKAIPWNRTYEALKITKSASIQEIEEFCGELFDIDKIDVGDIIIKNEHGDIASIDQVTFDMLFKSVM